MNTYQSMNPEAFQEEYEEEQRVLRQLAEEQRRIEVIGLAIDLSLAKLEVEMRERGEDFEPEYDEEDYFEYLDAVDNNDGWTEDDCPLDGDAESALASAGFGMDEDYNGGVFPEDGGDFWAD